MFLVSRPGGFLALLFVQGRCVFEWTMGTSGGEMKYNYHLKRGRRHYWCSVSNESNSFGHCMFNCLTLSLPLIKKWMFAFFFLVYFYPPFENDVHITGGSGQHQPLCMQHLQYIQTGCFNRWGGVAGFVFGREMNAHYSQYITIKWIFKESLSSSRAAGREHITHVKIRC